jgi:hypothetical protein
MELAEAPVTDEVGDPARTDVLHHHTRLRHEVRERAGCLDPEDVLGELEAADIGPEPAQVREALGLEACLFTELSPARSLRILARIDQPRG